MIKRLVSLAALPLLAAATPALAAINLDTSPPSGNFGNSTVTCASGTFSCAFSDTFTFVTPDGFNSVGATLSSGPATDAATTLIFGTLGLLSGVTLNGQMFNLKVADDYNFASLDPIPLTPGATNTLVVSGIAGQSGGGSYAGTLTFGNTAAVPEPATWATMLLGLAAAGWMLRRKRGTTVQAPRISFA